MNNKAEIRRDIQKIRDSIVPELRHAKDIEISRRFQSLTIYQSAQAIMFFVSFRSEVDTFSLINHALSLGKQVILPKVITLYFSDVHERRLIPVEINTLKDLRQFQLSKMGILEPISSLIFPLNKIDLIVMPGVAFDHKRNRLGYGGGYYDRFLSETIEKPYTIALAYQEQIIKEVPVETHDIKVDKIITDKEIIL